jgi:hypothetical protein
LIDHIASLVCSVLLIMGAKTKNLKFMAYWVCFAYLDIALKTVFMFVFGIPLLIIPIAFDIFSAIWLFSLVNQWEAEMDPEELQRQAEELDNNFDHCRSCENCLAVIRCVIA